MTEEAWEAVACSNRTECRVATDRAFDEAPSHERYVPQLSSSRKRR
jgi:hypothetical protein